MIKTTKEAQAFLFGGYECTAENNAATLMGGTFGFSMFGPIGGLIGAIGSVLYITYHCPNTQGYWG